MSKQEDKTIYGDLFVWMGTHGHAVSAKGETLSDVLNRAMNELTRLRTRDLAWAGIDDPAAFVAKVKEAVEHWENEDGMSVNDCLESIRTLLPKEPPHG